MTEPPKARAPQPAERESPDAAGIGPLLGELLRDLQALVRGEIALARAEVRDDLAAAGRGAAALALALVFGLTGFIFVMLAAVYVLHLWMRMWLASGLVGGALLALALLLALRGKKTLRAANLKPEQTIDSLKEDQAWAKRQINSASR